MNPFFDVDESIKELFILFKMIKKMGWIKSLRKGSSGIGYTFETLIGKKEDSFNLPDYKGVEIKTRRQYARSDFKLFTMSPDGLYINPIDELVNNYGYFDRKDNKYKVFRGTINASSYRLIGNNLFKLHIDNANKKIFLIIRNRNGEIIDDKISWDYKYLMEHLYRKLSFVAIIYASNKYIDGDEFFYYKSIYFYQLRGFDEFINLITNCDIKVNFNIGFKKNEKNYGKRYDHGTSFIIKPNKFHKLFIKKIFYKD